VEQNTNRQPAATSVEITKSCSYSADDGRKHRPKHVELIKVNKSKHLHHVVLSIVFVLTMHGNTNFKFLGVFFYALSHLPV
jgi:hypothetical protein